MKASRVSKEFLYNEYIVKGKTIRAICKENDWWQGTVQRWLAYYQIPRRPSHYERTPQHRQHLADLRRGEGRWLAENNPNWKGGVTPEHYGTQARNGTVWWRNTVKRRDNYICQNCGLDGKVPCEHCQMKPRMHADHIKLWVENPELRYDVDNGITLCENCHWNKKALGKSGELLETPSGQSAAKLEVNNSRRFND